MAYDFKALSSLDFELLTRDLLQGELGFRLEAFKTGKDRGMDLRYASAAGRPDIVVQCKHYAGSGIGKLVRDLRQKELPKVLRLNPHRYIVVTSLPLSAANKDDIAGALSPVVVKPGDILGSEDINGLLAKFPNVERGHFKLWLSSSAVLDRIVSAKIYNQSEIEAEAIQKRVRCYVQNESYYEAEKILEDLHYCIICGMPGIGKTMLADVLSLAYMSRGFQFVRITGDVDEAIAVYAKGKNQLFYYDDFLGMNSFAEKLGKNEDQRLLMLIDKMRDSPHHRFLLTTREYILNQAKETYERLSRSQFDLRRCTISIDRYTQRDRSKILVNHIYFSDVPREHREAMFATNHHRSIVRHRGFSPRIVEWMTTLLAKPFPSADVYAHEFLKNLDEPSRLWGHVFRNQLSASAQHLCVCLGTLPASVQLSDVRSAFAKIVGGDAGAIDSMLQSGLRELDGTFLNTYKNKKSGEIVVSFHNPSIRDFVEAKVRMDGQLAVSLMQSSVFFEQVEALARIVTGPQVSGEFGSRWAELLAEHAERTFECEPCALYPVFEGYYYEKASVFPEERLRGFMELAKRVPSARVHGAASEFVRAISRRWRADGTGESPWFLGETIGLIQAAEFVDEEVEAEAIDSLRVGLIGNAGTVDEFKCFTETLNDLSAITDVDRKAMAGRFVDMLDELVSVERVEKDEAMETLRQVAAVASDLGVDDSRIRDAIQSVEERADPEEDAPYSGPSREMPDAVADAIEDGELDAMFEALLEE